MDAFYGAKEKASEHVATSFAEVAGVSGPPKMGLVLSSSARSLRLHIKQSLD